MANDPFSHYRSLLNALNAAGGRNPLFAEWAAALEERLRQRMIALGDLPPDYDPYAGGVREPVRPKPAPRRDRVAVTLPD